MIRRMLISAVCTVVLSALMLPSTRADEFNDPFAAELETPPVSVPAPAAEDQPVIAQPIFAVATPTPQPAVFRQSSIVPGPAPEPMDSGAGATIPQGTVHQPGYVQLGAPMYPSPRPNIPIWTGSTMITSPALAPHEMLYPHTYRAMYPPYYHRVKGGWFWTPFGMRSHERWELQGTQVQVNYRSQYPSLSRGAWHPPTISYWKGAWR